MTSPARRLYVALAAAFAALALTIVGRGFGDRTDTPATSTGDTAAIRAERCQAVSTWQQARATADPDPLAQLREAPSLEVARDRTLRLIDEQRTALTPLLATLQRPDAPLEANRRRALEAVLTELTQARNAVAGASLADPESFANTLVGGFKTASDAGSSLGRVACPTPP